jgi:hypothetical protein
MPQHLQIHLLSFMPFPFSFRSDSLDSVLLSLWLSVFVYQSPDVWIVNVYIDISVLPA